jgi:hypothetical protein
MYVLGPLVVCCGFAAAVYMMTMGIAHVLPHKAPAWRPVHVVAMMLLAANFFFNYSHAILTDAGSAGGPSYEKLLCQARDAGLVDSQDYERQQLGVLSLATLQDPQFALSVEDPFGWSFCRRSSKLKPPRAHFDGVTNQLVLNMDHYCVRASCAVLQRCVGAVTVLSSAATVYYCHCALQVWVFNVVGYGNYRYFLLTVLQLWFASVFGFVETLGPYLTQRERWMALNATRSTAVLNGGGEAELAAAAQETEALWQLLVLCVVCILVIGHFAGWHVWHCVLNGRTTIEAYRRAAMVARGDVMALKSMGNPYSWGSRSANWSRYFGNRNFVAAL